MAFDSTLQKLVETPDRGVLLSFLHSNSVKWATTHMPSRYGMGLPQPEDGPLHPTRRCFALLQQEFDVLRGALSPTSSDRFAPTLWSLAMLSLASDRLGDGFGGDFQSSGVANAPAIRFKVAMISAYRMAESLDLAARRKPGPVMASVAQLIHGAHTSRAAAHSWRAPDGENGELQIHRWAAIRTFEHLVRLGAAADWAYENAKGPRALGRIDEAPGVLAARRPAPKTSVPQPVGIPVPEPLPTAPPDPS